MSVRAIPHSVLAFLIDDGVCHAERRENAFAQKFAIRLARNLGDN